MGAPFEELSGVAPGDDELGQPLQRHETEDEDGWTSVGSVGNYLRNQGSFDHRNYDFAKLSGLLHATGLFEERKTETANGSSVLAVRIRGGRRG